MRSALLAAALGAASVTAGAAAGVTPDEARAAVTIGADFLRAHVRFLSSDLLEGRLPATRGDDLAQSYIQAQMEALGLLPGAPDGGWRQSFDIVGITTRLPAAVSFEGSKGALTLKTFEEFIGVSGVQAERAQLEDAEIVFVGYGIRAPEYRWDDYKDADLKGKVLLMMNNDPEGDPALFAGRTRLYYGRWDYKYEQAARMGAAGAIIIHTDASASYGWKVVQSSWTGEQFELPAGDEPRTRLNAWATEEASRRIARLGGHDLDRLRTAAERRDFRPVPLGVRLSVEARSDITRKRTANVIGRLAGGDARHAREAVVYTAHHDHLGIVDTAAGGDRIHNGALDNASGIAAMLAIARAAAALEKPPKRSLYFAAVAAEEQGLLGSRWLAEHPPVPAGRIAANVNIDSMNIWGRTRDVTAVGLGKSSLDDGLRQLAALQGRRVVSDQFPEKGSYYRSDQFNFARIGVPAVYLKAGTDYVGQPAGWGRKTQQDYENRHYHQPSDELHDDWDYAGLIEDAQLMFHLGVEVANAPALPAWTPGDEFEAARKKALQDLQRPQ